MPINPFDLFRALHELANSQMVNHYRWLDKLRAAVPNSTIREILPTIQRCWVLQLWAQSDNFEIFYPDVEHWGWERTNHALKCVWDSPENLADIQLCVDA